MRQPQLRDLGVMAGGDLAQYLTGWVTPTIKLGVTGLARSGKTVFITALVRNLVEGGRLPFFSAAAEHRIEAAYLEPQPDDELPRFPYERHVAALTSDPPEWPRSTTRISQLRITLELKPMSRIAEYIGQKKLHVDVIDYPGEWLLDIPLMEQSYRTWSEQVIERARRPDHAAAAAAFLDAIDAIVPSQSYDEDIAQRLAEAFRAYLAAARALPPGLATLGPGRFLMPGDLEGSPLLTFAPLPASSLPSDGSAGRQTLAGELGRRYESYKSKVVRPFFETHFSRIDRQIVLVDVLSALNGGATAVNDLKLAIEASLRAFRPGARSWLGRLIGRRRIDRVLFAAAKADHIPQTSHDRLAAILRHLMETSSDRALGLGAEIEATAVAAIRSTREARAVVDGESLPCLVGVPMPGERIGDDVFDGCREAAVFPGDLPAHPASILSQVDAGRGLDLTFVRFRPPVLEAAGAADRSRAWPHIRLDRAIEFLIGDRLP